MATEPDPLPTDVICGRGNKKTTTSNPANIRFRALIEENKAAYQNSKHRDGTYISSSERASDEEETGTLSLRNGLFETRTHTNILIHPSCNFHIPVSLFVFIKLYCIHH